MEPQVGAHLTLNFGARKFYDIRIPCYSELANLNSEGDASSIKLFSYVEENCIGKDLQFNSPFGELPVTYCDFTASGKALRFIEDFIQDEVLPHYGNTHTTTSVTSLQTTLFRHEARDIIRSAVNANEADVVIFVSSGVTGAIHKLIHALNMQKPPVVFVSPYEHHSNLLSWKEIGGEIVWNREDENGGIDIVDLENNLKKYQGCGRPLIGCFSAASNVTGILTAVDRVAACLHAYGALAFFDYATAAPYVEVNMNPLPINEKYGECHKDAVFISTHKFVGGPGTPGLLIAKKTLFKNSVPSQSGGGTVFYVTHHTQRYLKEIEMREEGGTPDIVGSIRAGLVFQLKQSIGTSNIMDREEALVREALEKWRGIPNLIILGNSPAKRLPIFSFVVLHQESGRLLHHNFVCALLNDVFGIQARGGCACAGPYAEDLLGMDEETALKLESLILEDHRLDRNHLRRYGEFSEREVLRPGFARINLPFFMSDEGVDYVLKSVSMVAEHGWKLLPQYKMNPSTGEWRHSKNFTFQDRKWLGGINYRKGLIDYPLSPRWKENVPTYKERLQNAMKQFEMVVAKKVSVQPPDESLVFGDDGEKYRWFVLPSEAALFLSGFKPPGIHFKMPFFPRKDVKDSKIKSRVPSRSMRNPHICVSCRSGSIINPDELKTGIFCENQSDNLLSFNSTSDTDTSCTVEFSTKSREEYRCEKFEDKEFRNFNSMSDRAATSDVQILGRSSIKALVEYDDQNNEERHEEEIFHTAKFHNPPKSIFSEVVKAISEYSMIGDKDRVLLCLSGGKDSLSMLHVIHQYQFYAKSLGINFEYGAMTVDPKSFSYNPSPLKHYLSSLNVPYFYEEQDIMAQASNLKSCDSICSFCSRMKRGRIYACARREGYNVIAMGHHLDDIAESFMMSVFHNGLLRTMKASYTIRSV